MQLPKWLHSKPLAKEGAWGHSPGKSFTPLEDETLFIIVYPLLETFYPPVLQYIVWLWTYCTVVLHVS